ncbi:MAG TPA: polysaccharide pyruvyl transferase family protein, partial [Planctomycetota bacterium]|nr:polysaccharide pyruvyl transferase family protein [Planctomycetota bacterium]
ESDARIVLVPHVLGGAESDVPACERVLGELGADARDRVAILPPIYDQSEIKWVISRFDWFCGTRMHSTIAALSTGVPTAAIAYSLKTLGVFETCEQGEHVADPRSMETEEVVARVWSSFETRRSTREKLAKTAPEVVRRAEAQMDEILAACGCAAVMEEAAS